MKFVKTIAMDTLEFDILVIGAGAAGMIGALEIALAGKSVAVIEAKDRTGGRIKTVVENGHAMELGAEFVHGNLPLTRQLLQQAGAKTNVTNGSIWQFKEGQLQQQEDFITDYQTLEKKFKALNGDKSVADFLKKDLKSDEYKELRFSLQNYVEGYYAANIDKASTEALCKELASDDEEQYRIEGGYGQLVALLEKQCREAGVRFFLSQPVLQLQWEKNSVTAITEQNTFSGKKALLTVSIGVLQQEGITFIPALPQVKESVKSLGFGHVVKMLFQFDTAFWVDKKLTRQKDLRDLGFLFSEEKIPTWWTHYPEKEAVLTGWLGGPKAAEFQPSSTYDLQQKALSALSCIFSIDVGHLQQKLEKMHYYNWSADAHFCGAYSFEVVNGEKWIKEMQQPVEETLFFAGEGLHHGKEIGTVEAALQSGKSVANRLLHDFPF